MAAAIAMAASGAPTAGERARLAALAWACAAFTAGVLLHVDRVPAWASASALALVAWRLATARTVRWAPGTAARALLALALVALVLLRFRTLNGLAAGTTLLILMSGLKLLETRSARDQWVLVGAGLFLLLAACLDREDLARAPLYALQAWLCCAAFAVIAVPQLRMRSAVLLAGRALLYSLPLAVLLFLFFPRLPGSFWAIPRGAEALTGLSDTMSPGSIVELVASYDAAFRVHFSGAAPPHEDLYWRGPVLHEFDGRTWRRSRELFAPRQPLQYLGRPYRYHVWLEPSRHPWWFALDTPAASPDPHVLLTYDHLLVSAEPVTQTAAFDALSYTLTRAAAPLDPVARRQDSALPPDANPRSVALARQLWQRAASDADFVQSVLEYLRRGGFVYTLTPGVLGPDPVDEFLFDTRAGFCGHYASAFVTLMRAAGVPARVVTGYLGGEWNPVGGYYIVRQADAHAWAEVWLTGRGWTRIDPTAVIAPERLNRGILDLIPGALSARERLLRSAWLATLLQRWDAANSWWSEHVLKFDYARQLDLLGSLGVRAPDARQLGWAFLLALIAWLTVVAWHVGRSPRTGRADALARAYARLCSKLARVAPARAPHQGPLSLAATISAHRPELAARAAALLGRYAELRYGRPQPTRARDVEDFRHAVARLSLPR